MMVGTLVNTGTILAGSLIGGALRKGIPEKFQNALYNAMGFASLCLGLRAAVNNMNTSIYPVLFIVSLAIGSLFGEIIDLDGKFMRLTARFSKSEENSLGQGLSTGILLFCIGTLSILGPIQSALYGDHTFLFTNATLDFVTSMVLASTYGFGMMVAAGVLFCWQGSIYMLAGVLQPVLTPELLAEISIVGGILITASGLNILKIKKLKTLNMLPALLIPPIWFAIMHFIH